MKFGAIDLTGGMVYSVGSAESERAVNLSNPDDGIIPDEDDKLDIGYRRFKLIFGFSVGF